MTKEEYKLKRHLYYLKNRDKIIKKVKEYSENNKEKILKRAKEYRDTHKEKIASYKKEYYKINKENISKYKKEYASKNRDKLNNYHKEYQSKRLHNDDLHKFKQQVRHLIYLSFRRYSSKKTLKSEEIIGCNFNELRIYLLQTFKNNYGYDYDGVESVHIDHIKPLITAKSKEDIIKLCHYTNLQLLKSTDNLKKSAKVESNFGNCGFLVE